MTISPPIAAHLQREGEAAAVRGGAAQLHALGRLQLGGDGGGHHLAAQRGLGVRVHQSQHRFFCCKSPYHGLIHTIYKKCGLLSFIALLTKGPKVSI